MAINYLNKLSAVFLSAPIILILSPVFLVVYGYFDVETIFGNIPNFISFSFLISLFCFLSFFIVLFNFYPGWIDFSLRISDLIWVTFSAVGVVGGAYSLYVKDIEIERDAAWRKFQIETPKIADADAACGKILNLKKEELTNSGNFVYVFCNEIVFKQYSTSDSVCEKFIDYTDSNDGIVWLRNSENSSILNSYFYTVSNYCHLVRNQYYNLYLYKKLNNQIKKTQSVFNISNYFWLLLLSMAAGLRLTKSVVDIFWPKIKNLHSDFLLKQ